MPTKRSSAKRTTAKKETAKRERVVVDEDEFTDIPTPKKSKRTGKAKTSDGLADLFETYLAASTAGEMDADESNPDLMGPAGIEKMCEDIDMSLDNIALLIMAWHVGASRAGFFSREEWMKLANFGITDMATLKSRVPQFPKDIKHADNLKRLFMFTFNYVRETPDTKVISVDLAEGYIRLLLPDCPHTDPFCNFLMEQKTDPKGYRVFNLDQWKMWYEFANSVPADLSNYDESGAWPLVIDNYVVARKTQLEQAAMKTA